MLKHIYRSFFVVILSLLDMLRNIPAESGSGDARPNQGIGPSVAELQLEQTILPRTFTKQSIKPSGESFYRCSKWEAMINNRQQKSVINTKMKKWESLPQGPC
jgi:hypothetical protein